MKKEIQIQIHEYKTDENNTKRPINSRTHTTDIDKNRDSDTDTQQHRKIQKRRKQHPETNQFTYTYSRYRQKKEIRVRIHEYTRKYNQPPQEAIQKDHSKFKKKDYHENKNKNLLRECSEIEQVRKHRPTCTQNKQPATTRGNTKKPQQIKKRDLDQKKTRANEKNADQHAHKKATSHRKGQHKETMAIENKRLYPKNQSPLGR